MKAIETIYKGYRFRSRLEARWAVFFDALGLKWEYEPEGFDLGGLCYLPDFKVEYPGRDNTEVHHEWFEIKGDIRNISLEECKKIIRFGRELGVTILDGTPRPTVFLSIEPPKMLMDPETCPQWYLEDYKNAYGDPDVASLESSPISATKLQDELLRLASIEDEERFGVALWSGKGRLWWDSHRDYFSPTTYFGLDRSIEIASDVARSARFEHGETPRVFA